LSLLQSLLAWGVHVVLQPDHSTRYTMKCKPNDQALLVSEWCTCRCACSRLSNFLCFLGSSSTRAPFWRNMSEYQSSLLACLLNCSTQVSSSRLADQYATRRRKKRTRDCGTSPEDSFYRFEQSYPLFPLFSFAFWTLRLQNHKRTKTRHHAGGGMHPDPGADMHTNCSSIPIEWLVCKWKCRRNYVASVVFVSVVRKGGCRFNVQRLPL
jgi:hypothetical protein